MAQRILDIVAKDPEDKHVPDKMHQVGMCQRVAEQTDPGIGRHRLLPEIASTEGQPARQVVRPYLHEEQQGA